MNNEQISWIRSAGQLCVALSLFGFAVPAVAQLVPDTTLGAERSLVIPDAMVRGASGTLIEGGAVRGSNLFQSFQEFNVGNGQRVYFANPIGVQTIFSRVTGANASNILGTLGVNGGASLFLLNPNGILFGPNAQLDIRGSFLATTDRVVFADGSTFGASNPQAAPLLTMSAPVGVQYGANATGTIQNRGNLTVGQDLTLSANHLDLQGQLQAGRDLHLQAQDTVQIRDTITQPFLARSGRDLTIQGNQSIDILALNHLTQTPFISGGNTTLISNNSVSADAHFSSGGNFVVQTVIGNIGNLFSRFDPVFDVAGDYTIGNYTGASLEVNAGGNITYGTVTISAIDPLVDPKPAFILTAGGNITGTGTVSTTVASGELLVDFSSGGTTTIGNISTQGGEVLIEAQGGITTGVINASSSGIAGDITLNAVGDIRTGNLTSRGNFSSIYDDDDENYNVITLMSKNGSVFLNRAKLDTSNTNINGYAGDILIDAARNIEIVNSTIQSKGDFGRILIGSASTPANISIRSSNLSTDSRRATSFGNNANSGAIQIQGTAITIGTSDLSTNAYNGAAGDISILAGATNGTAITLTNTSIDAAAFGPLGKTGGITLKAFNRGDITLQGQGGRESYRTIFTDTHGNQPTSGITVFGGDISIDNYIFNSETASLVDGGKILIDGRSIFLSNQAQIRTDVVGNAGGNAGQIFITGDSLSLTGDSQISGRIQEGAKGNAGNVTIMTTGAIVLDGNNSRISSSVMKGAVGNGGNVLLKTGSLSVSNKAAIAASTQGQGKAGTVTLDVAGEVFLQQGGRLSSAVRAGAIGNGGTVKLTAGSLKLESGGKIEGLVEGSDVTPGIPAGQGNAGSIQLSVQGLTSLSGAKTTIVNSIGQGAKGAGGNISLHTGSLIIADSASIDSTLSGAGNRAGDIKITAADQINLQNGAGITASNRSKEQGGLAGNITLSARLLKLDTNASITAETGSGGGGNIQITARDLLLLRRNSEISTTAGTPASGGNGGNITITAPKGFLIAVPSENSDIIANAFGGKGGTIKIAANRVFGLQTRDRLSPAQLSDIRRNGTSDISASSDVGLDGQISISTLQIDPSQGLAEVPVDLIDPSSLIAQGCQPGNAAIAKRRSEFVVTGRGGLPPGPSDVQMGDDGSVPWVSQARVAQAPRQSAVVDKLTTEQPLVEAQGIAIAPNGSAFLTAQTTAATPTQSGFATTICPQR